MLVQPVKLNKILYPDKKRLIHISATISVIFQSKYKLLHSSILIKTICEN